MSLDHALTMGRRAAEARMTSRCTIRRRKARGQQDESNGREPPTWATIYTDPPCRLGSTDGGSAPSRTITIADTEHQVGSRVLSLPALATLVTDDDLVEITSGENADSVWRIVEADWADQQTARRLPVIATGRPQEWT